MIPKKLHYCWFGGKVLPEDAQKCLESWKKFCPDYEIVRWDESNSGYESCRFSREAYEQKKWAFVSDYARIKGLYEQGGVYLDTDVELVKPLDSLMDGHSFAGWESAEFLGTNVLAAEPGCPWLERVLRYYEGEAFVLKEGGLNVLPNPYVITDILNKDFALSADGSNTARLKIYPKEFFNPMNMNTGKIELTENTHSIHHYTASWYTPKQRFKRFLKKAFVKVFGEKAYLKIRGKNAK